MTIIRIKSNPLKSFYRRNVRTCDTAIERHRENRKILPAVGPGCPRKAFHKSQTLKIEEYKKLLLKPLRKRFAH